MNWQKIEATTPQQYHRLTNSQAEETAALQQLQRQVGPEWELKILRSTPHAFASMADVTAAAAQEARAGWEIVQRWDDTRLIFKRRVPVGREAATTPTDFMQALVGVILLMGTLIGLAIMLGTGA
ncbi:hypothetical protein ACFLYO_08810 [Chloroflexota bacterium]